MGQTKSDIFRKYFEFNDVGNTQKCKIINCSTVLTGNNLTNLKRCLQKKHAVECAEVEKSFQATSMLQSISKRHKLSSIHIHHSESLLWEGCVQIVTNGGLPFSFIDQPGFKKIINPILSSFPVEKQLNQPNLKEKTMEAASKVKVNKIGFGRQIVFFKDF